MVYILLLWGGVEIERVVSVKVAAKTNMHHFSNFLEIVIFYSINNIYS